MKNLMCYNEYTIKLDKRKGLFWNSYDFGLKSDAEYVMILMHASRCSAHPRDFVFL
jgi:hypothetical protein